jgi:hypothetical protein
MLNENLYASLCESEEQVAEYLLQQKLFRRECNDKIKHSIHYNKCFQQMRLCFMSLFHISSLTLHVSGLLRPIIGGILSCCFYATIWFMQCLLTVCVL